MLRPGKGLEGVSGKVVYAEWCRRGGVYSPKGREGRR